MTGVGFNVRGLSDAAAKAVQKMADRTPLKPWRVSVCRPPMQGAANPAGCTVVISGDGWKSYGRHPSSADEARRRALAAIGWAVKTRPGGELIPGAS